MSDAKKSIKRRSHYNKALFVGGAIILAVPLCAGLIMPGMRYYTEQQAIKRITESGGKVETRICRPDWIPKLNGVKGLTLFERAVRVNWDLAGPLGSIQDVERLQKFDELEELSLVIRTGDAHAVVNQVSRLPNLKTHSLTMLRPNDSDIGQLRKLTNVQELSLDFDITNVTDTGWEQLQDLNNLQSLDFNNMKDIGDSKLETLGKLTQLRDLNLGMTSVTDRGMKHLAKLKNLQTLKLYGNAITDAGMPYLGELTELRSLLLDGFITDEGLQHLNGLTKLENLRIEISYASDAGLKHLHGLSNLRFLGLDDSDPANPEARENEVTEAGVNALKQALPNCRIDWP